MNAHSIRSALEFAPQQAPPSPANLRGWWIPDDNGDLLYVCARCSGRMIARGVSLGRDARPVWADKPEPYGVCVGCGIDPEPDADMGRMEHDDCGDN